MQFQAATKGFAPSLFRCSAPWVLTPWPLRSGSAERHLKRYLQGTGIFLVGDFSARPFKPYHRKRKPVLRVFASGRCVCLTAWHLGTRVYQSSRTSSGATNYLAADIGFPRCVTARLLARTVHLRTATLPLAGTPCSRCSAHAHRPCIVSSDSRGIGLSGAQLPYRSQV